MAKNRVIYQTEAVYVGPTGANPCTGPHYSASTYGGANVTGAGGIAGANWVEQLFRVQSANYSFNKTLKDVNQFGELGAIDRIPIDQPTVSLDLSWLTANLVNENLIGLTLSTGSQVSALSGILNLSTDSKNYFILTTSEGTDADGASSLLTTGVPNIAIGNGFLSSYTAEGSVGNFPTASIRVEGLNIEFNNRSTGVRIPAVNPSDGTSITGWGFQLPLATQNADGATINTQANNYSVLRPGDVELNLGVSPSTAIGAGGVLESDMKAQNYSISADLSRQNLDKLGSKYAFAKVINFPLNATMTVTANVGDSQTGSLVEMVNNNDTFNPYVRIYKPGTAKTRDNIVAEWQLKGAKMDSQEFSSSIGPSKSVTMRFTTQISGPNSSNGFFISGSTIVA